MEQTSFTRYLEPPPRLAPATEALPRFGGLTLSPYRGELPDELEPHPASTPQDAFEDEAAQQMLKRALAIEKVRARLGRGRVTPIGLSRRGEPAKGEARTYLVVAYDYSANVAVEIRLDERGEVLGINEESYQPPLIQEEIDRAIELARSHERFEGRLEGLAAMAIPFSGVNNEWTNRRVVEVVFGCRTDRLPTYRAWVDLGTDQVIHAAGAHECAGQPAEVSS